MNLTKLPCALAALLGIHLAACEKPPAPPAAPAAAASTPPPAQVKEGPILSVSPDPIPLGPGNGVATIEWDTADGTPGQIYVSKDGVPEALFTAGSSGSEKAPWIETGARYEFHLYQGLNKEKLLNTLSFTRGKPSSQ